MSLRFLRHAFIQFISNAFSEAFRTCSHGLLTLNEIYEKRNLPLPVRPGFSKL
jgi:hypothetical protein